MNFSVGPTIACRRQIFQDIGGFSRVKDSYIDDLLVGRYAHEAGWKVELSSYVIEHRIGTQSFRANCKHRVTWLRGTRCSRPSGYYGQIFTYPTPWALVLTLINGAWWPLLVATVLLRALAAHATGEWVLHDTLTRRLWFLVPLQDLWSWFFYWLAYFGRTMTWRGRKYTIRPGGDLTPYLRP
jgi:ceramide glucosyltransferase